MSSRTVTIAALAILALTPARARARVDVLTYHGDAARTGQNLAETVLTPATVGSARFGKLFDVYVDGFVYAQPLVVTGVAVPGEGAHDLVVVATERDGVYAFDALTRGRPLWRARLLDRTLGERPVSSVAVECEDLVPQIGITSTPVIDAATGTLYVVAKTVEHRRFHQWLHALDVATGAEKLGGPVEIRASAPGTGDGHVAGVITFDPRRQHQRSALLLANGSVYIAWASHCDNGPYHGWVMRYDATTLEQQAAFLTTPDGTRGGIWMAGGGPAADAAGNLYVSTGNGTFDADRGGRDFGDSVLRLDPALNLADSFTPFDQARLEANDDDLGSGGMLVLPDQPGPHPHLLVMAGKAGTIYLIDRDAMGHFHEGDDSQIVQAIPDWPIRTLFGTAAYWNGRVYFLATGDWLKAFALTDGLLSTSPVDSSTARYGFPGATPTISANGASAGIVWVIEHAKRAVLHAFDASDLTHELFDGAARPRDRAGKAVKFTVPTVANGRVYVGAQRRVSVYGLRF